MSKYKMPYHFVEYCDRNSIYRKHVDDLIQKIETYIALPGRIYEVGCGEGLILTKLRECGYETGGNDSDSAAVRMANDLGSWVEESSDRYLRPIEHCKAVLFSDSLEHLDYFKEHIDWAKRSADFVVIAVPDRHDRHGLRDFDIDSFDDIFKGWECVHRATRHARHLLVFKREA